jgi:hypothetical protein
MKKTASWKILLIHLSFILGFIGVSVFVSAQVSAEQLELSGSWLPESFVELDDGEWNRNTEKGHMKKMDLNRISREQLGTIGKLTLWQVDQFFRYKSAMGDFKDIYELQSIPGWDPALVRSLIPYFKIESINIKDWVLENRLLEQSTLTFRIRDIQNRNTIPSDWVGSGVGMQLLYRYRSPVFQLGFSIDKDPGEKIVNSKVGSGVDFMSIHATLQTKGFIKNVILGDFTVNFGQGLIQWQAFAFRKTPEIALLKKQGATFRPYRSIGEFNFHRGAAISWVRKIHSVDFFVSSRMLSANYGVSAINGMVGVTSFNTHGYHRTKQEISKRNNLHQWTTGVRYSLHHKSSSGGINAVAYQFSMPLVVTAKAYDRNSINSNFWMNASVDYSFYLHNWHFFTENAIDKKGAYAGLFGGLLSLTKQLDVGLLLRMLSKKYQSLYATSFTESSLPSNENGFFFCINASPFSKLQLHLFADVFCFPWLRYTINHPSVGMENLLQLTYRPTKSEEFLILARAEQKDHNVSSADAPGPIKAVASLQKRVWRFQWQKKLGDKSRFTIRVESTSLFSLSNDNLPASKGFLSFIDWKYVWGRSGFSSHLRCQFFDTDSYESAVYAFTPQIGGNYQLSQYSGRGSNYMLLIENELFKHVSCKGSVVYDCLTKGAPSKLRFSLQMAMKLHHLAPPKNYAAF